jgi:hypothetical protein
MHVLSEEQAISGNNYRKQKDHPAVFVASVRDAHHRSVPNSDWDIDQGIGVQGTYAVRAINVFGNHSIPRTIAASGESHDQFGEWQVRLRRTDLATVDLTADCRNCIGR